MREPGPYSGAWARPAAHRPAVSGPRRRVAGVPRPYAVVRRTRRRGGAVVPVGCERLRGVGGVVTGVVPRQLAYQDLAHESLSRLYVVDTMHERKHKMQALAHACLALPGGFGTIEEDLRSAHLGATAARVA